MNLCLVLSLLGCLMVSCGGLNNGLVRTPPMGWLSWERFLCVVDCKNYPDSCISENLYKEMADIMAKEGYLEAGYEFVNIDDCWMSDTRGFDGLLQANYTRFPHGIKWLADYVHSRGLKLGIYQDCGTKTCGGYPGSEGFFKKDAETYAKWDVDMLKLDGCYADVNDMDNVYPAMTKALNKSGRAIVYSCSWPAYQFESRKPDYKRIAENCNLWRNYNDIVDSWQSVTSIMDYYAKVQDDLIPFSGPGAWSDPDMLMIGNFGLTVDEAEAQMAVWSILAAPLFMSTDLRTIRPEFKKILLNKQVISVNQDSFGQMGRRVYSGKNKMEIWMRPVGPMDQDGSMSAAIAFLSRRDMGSAVLMNVSLSSLGMNFELGYTVDDLFGDQIKGRVLFPNDYLDVKVNPSGVVMLKATVNNPPTTTTTSTTSAPTSRERVQAEKVLLSMIGHGPVVRGSQRKHKMGQMGRDGHD